MVPLGNWAFMVREGRNGENYKQYTQTCSLISWVVKERAIRQRKGTAAGGERTSEAQDMNPLRGREI